MMLMVLCSMLVVVVKVVCWYVSMYVCKMRWVGMRTGSQSVEEQLVVAATTEVGKSTNTNTKTR